MEPDKRSGKPCIRGFRITVQDILEYLAGGMTADEIIADFPQLTVDDIRACFSLIGIVEVALRTGMHESPPCHLLHLVHLDVHLIAHLVDHLVPLIVHLVHLIVPVSGLPFASLSSGNSMP
jgi:hypothetical protein